MNASRFQRALGLGIVLAGCSSSSNSPETPAQDGGPASADAANNNDSSHPMPGTDAESLPDVSTFVDQVAPTPTGNWTNVTGTLAGMSSECGNLTSVSSHPSYDMLIAGIALQGLWASTDGAASWHQLGTGAGSAMITNRPSNFVYDPANKDTWWEAGIYNGTGVYRTTDNGMTFTALGDTHHNDSVGIDFTDPMRKTLLAGGHEQMQMVFLSTDSGMSPWTNVGMNLPSNLNFCTQVLVFDSQTFEVGCSGYAQAPDGIYRTTNAGQTWAPVSDLNPHAPALRAADGSIYWPLDLDGGIAKSVDQGMTWTKVQGGGVLRTVQPVELPDHRIAAVGQQTIIISADGGMTWTPASDMLPYQPYSLMYSAFRRAFFIAHNDCSNSVPADAIEETGFDYTKQ